MAAETKKSTPKEAPPSAAKQAQQVAGLVIGFVVVANIMFYFLSDLYFADKSKDLLKSNHFDADAMGRVRMAFGIFSAIVGAGAVMATFKPKLVGHGLAAVAGVFSVIASYEAFTHDMPMVLPVTLLILGGALPTLAYYSMEKKMRSAWSFLIAICGVFAMVLLFGAPKVRGVLGIGLWTALIIPGLLTVATVALSMVRDEYREV
jgi:hypothetical protein